MANEKRLIGANAFKIFLEEVRQDYIEEDTFSSDFAAKVIETVQDEYLANAPTVDAVEVVHGRWIYVDGKGSHAEYECNQCRTHVCFDEQIDGSIPAYKHCPNCGAKMDGGADE